MASTPKTGTALTEVLPTLASVPLKVTDLLPKFGIKKKGIDPDKFINKFITINQESFKFLDIEVKPYRNDDIDRGVIITTSRYAGSVPIKSPISSQFTVDLRVKGSYNKKTSDEQIFNLLGRLNLIQLPEYYDKLKLVSNYHRPPTYIETLNFVNLYIEARRIHWTKFVSIFKDESVARGSTDWISYSLEIDPQKKLNFHNKINSQTLFHKEWKQINFVLKKCIEELNSHPTPNKIRNTYSEKLSLLKRGLNKNTITSVKEFKISGHDPIIIKELKKIGNMILQDNSNVDYAWRFDIAELYEKYIGYIFQNSSKSYGWSLKTNQKYPITGDKTSWTLNYLEPDIILCKNSNQIIIDAKYKSYFLQGRKKSNDNTRKESFRHDLHQVLAYSTFLNSEQKNVFIVCPIFIKENKEENNNGENEKKNQGSLTLIRHQSISSPFSLTKVNIYLIGIPLIFDKIDKIVEEVKKYISDFFPH